MIDPQSLKPSGAIAEVWEAHAFLRAGDGVPPIANFRDTPHQQSLFRQNAETNTRNACVSQNYRFSVRSMTLGD